MTGALLVNDQILCNTPSDKQEEITNVINQASKSWMMPTDIIISYFGIGTPNVDVVNGAYYLDVVTGSVYLGGTKWTLNRTLTSVQSELDSNSLIIADLQSKLNSNSSTIATLQSTVTSLKNYRDTIGTVVNGTKVATTVPSSTKTLVNQILEFPSPGVYFVRAYLRWDSTLTAGRRAIYLAPSATTPQYDLWAYSEGAFAKEGPGNNFVQTIEIVVNATATTKRYLWAFQNSGNTISAELNSVSAIRIG